MERRKFQHIVADTIQPRQLPYLITREGVLANGPSNLGPDIVEEIILQSPSALQCAETYKSYLAGSYFDVEDINLSLYGWEPYTINDLLVDTCYSVSRHGGAFIHVTYDGNLQARSFKVLPYQNCRISLADDTGYIRYIVYKKFGWNPSISYTYKKHNKAEKYNTFNPIPNVLEAQVEAFGGVKNFPGQIYYLKVDSRYPYTIGLIESVKNLAQADTLANIYYNNRLEGGFQNAKMIRHSHHLSERDSEILVQELKSALGARNTNSILRVADDIGANNPNGSFTIENIGNDTPADVYSYIDGQISDKIRRAFLNIPHQLIQTSAGRLGSSAELREAVSIYNSFTADHRNTIQRKLQYLFTNFYQPIELGEIGVYRVLDDGSITEQAPTNDNIITEASVLAGKDKFAFLLNAINELKDGLLTKKIIFDRALNNTK